MFGDDACSNVINIPVKFQFGNLEHITAYVSVHSTLIFLSSQTELPTLSYKRTDKPCVQQNNTSIINLFHL